MTSPKGGTKYLWKAVDAWVSVDGALVGAASLWSQGNKLHYMYADTNYSVESAGGDALESRSWGRLWGQHRIDNTDAKYCILHWGMQLK